VSLGISIYYLLQGNTLLAGAFLIVACFLPWWDVYGNYVPYLQGKKEFGILTRYETGAVILNAVAIVGIVF